MKALVTGGAGFIGSHVVDSLIADGIEPLIFDQRPSPHHPDVPTRVGELGDRKALTKAMAGCDVVLHLAAMADADRVAKAPVEAEESNTRGTMNVLEAAQQAGVKRIVYASTIWVYSDAGQSAVDEDTPLGLPAHLYTATKLAGEMYCRSYAELYGLEYTILRFGIPYGPRCRPEAVVPKFVAKALNGDALTVAGDGSQSRRFVYVEDLARGVVAGLHPDAANRIYNLVGDEDVTILQIAETVRAEVAPVELERVPGRTGDLGSIQVSGERAERELGWRAATPFAEGIRRYVGWHRDQVEAQGEVQAPAAATVAGRPARVAWRGLGIAQVPAMAAMVLAFLWLIHAVGAEAFDLHTTAITTMLALTTFLAAAGGASGRVPAWLCALVSVVLVLLWPHDLTRLVSSDVDLVMLGLTGAGFGVAVGMAGNQLARLQPQESTSG
jgi:UDP-glucose 4-epimerase